MREQGIQFGFYYSQLLEWHEPVGGGNRTHNDSWGYIAHDMNFKSPGEIIQLLAEVASDVV